MSTLIHTSDYSIDLFSFVRGLFLAHSIFKITITEYNYNNIRFGSDIFGVEFSSEQKAVKFRY